MSNVRDNVINGKEAEAKLIRSVDNRVCRGAFAILVAVSLSISWSGSVLAGTTSSVQSLSSSYLHDHELVAGIPFMKSKDDNAKAKQDKKSDDEKKTKKEKVKEKSDAKAAATKKNADKEAEKTAREAEKTAEKLKQIEQPESKKPAASKEKSKSKAAKKDGKGNPSITGNEQTESPVGKPRKEKNSATNPIRESSAHDSSVRKAAADGALISLLNDVVRALKDPAEQSKLSDADQKFVLSVAAEVLSKALESRSDANRIIDKKGMSGPMSVESWSSGDVTVSEDCRGSIAAVWAKKENGLLDVTIAGACHNRTAPSGKKIGEYVVVLSAHSGVQKGFEIQSQADVQFWLAKLDSIRIEADCCSHDASAQEKTSTNIESETKELRRNSTVVLQSVVTEREHELASSRAKITNETSSKIGDTPSSDSLGKKRSSDLVVAKALLDQSTSQVGDKPLSDTSTSQVVDKPSSDPSTSQVADKPSSDPSTSQVVDKPTSSPSTSIVVDKPSSDPSTSQVADKPSSDPSTSQVVDKPTSSPSTSIVVDKPSSDSSTPKVVDKPSSDSSTPKVVDKPSSDSSSTESDKVATEIDSAKSEKKDLTKAQEKQRAKEEKLAEAEQKRKAADQERQAKIAEKEKEKQDELRADAAAEKQQRQDELEAQAEKDREAQEKQRLAEAKKQEKYQAKQAELDRKRISAESKPNSLDGDMSKSSQKDSAERVAQNTSKNSHMSLEDRILAEATRQVEIEAHGGTVAPESFNSESNSRADKVLAEAMRQAEQERREAADMRVPYSAQTNPPVVEIDDQQTALRPTPTASEQASNESKPGSQSVPSNQASSGSQSVSYKESSNNLASTEKTTNEDVTKTTEIASVSPPASSESVSVTAPVSSGDVSAPSKNSPSLLGTRMVLPERSIAGQYITAAVTDQKNIGASGVELRFNGVTLFTDARGEVAYKVPDDTTPGESLNVAMPGNPRIRLFPIEVLQPLTTSSEQGAPTVERASKMVASNRTLVIGGHNFDGMAAHNVITVDNSQECKVLAASPVELIVAVPNTIALGPHHAAVSMGSLRSNVFGFDVVAPQVVSSPNSPHSVPLNRIFVKVLGTTNKVQLHLTNETPDVIKVSPGNDVHLTSSGGKNNTASVTFQRLRKGSYRVSAVID